VLSVQGSIIKILLSSRAQLADKATVLLVSFGFTDDAASAAVRGVCADDAPTADEASCRSRTGTCRERL